MKRRTFLPTLFAFFCSLLITVSCAQGTPQAECALPMHPPTATPVSR